MSNNDSNLLGIRDIVLMNVIAILSLRQIPNVAPYGASAMILWFLAAACLFFPLAMVCGELSTGWPKDGGIFVHPDVDGRKAPGCTIGNGAKCAHQVPVLFHPVIQKIPRHPVKNGIHISFLSVPRGLWVSVGTFSFQQSPCQPCQPKNQWKLRQSVAL